MTVLQSHLMLGWVRHRRVKPRAHSFKYPVFMSWIDLDELDSMLEKSKLWSKERFNLVSFYRKDFLGTSENKLEDAVKHRIKQQTGNEFNGRICLLTNLRYLGFAFNSVSFYFCYPQDADQPRYILAEITNTPWNERHCYVLDTETSPQKSHFSFTFDKVFHVSPFMPMQCRYDWYFKLKPGHLTIHMALQQAQQHYFDATLRLKPQSLNHKTMISTPLKYPFMTLSVMFKIYWQAFRLWLKGIPFYDHPGQ